MVISYYKPGRVQDDTFYILPQITVAISKRISFAIVLMFRWGDIAGGASFLFE